MLKVEEETIATLEVKQSKFIAHLLPYTQFSQKLQTLKLNHPKARHFVTAYRYINEFGQIVEGSSDDGEPRGTSGKPSLMVLSGKDIVEVGVIVVRYFGGTKLGTGGLVRAYSDAVNLVLEESRLLEYKLEEQRNIMFGYDAVRKVEYELEKFGIDVLRKEFLESVCFTLKAPKELLDNFLSTLDCITHIPHRQEDTKSK